MFRTASIFPALGLVLSIAGGCWAAEEIDMLGGKGLAGWTCYLRDSNADFDAKMKNVWSIHDGVLRCEGQPIGYIRTKKKYTNYILKLQWRWPKGSKPGNSGVLLRIVGPDKVWPKSVEAQLQDQWAGDIWNIGSFPMKVEPKRTKGDRTLRIHPSNEKPQAEWNQYEIILKGGNLTLKVNGLIQNTAAEIEEMPGYIGLQSEGAPIEYRNIRLTVLDK